MNSHATDTELAMIFAEAANRTKNYLAVLGADNYKTATAMLIDCAITLSDAIANNDDKHSRMKYAIERIELTAHLITEFAAYDMIAAIDTFDKKLYCNAIIAEVQPKLMHYRKSFDATQALLKEIEQSKIYFGKPALMYAKRLTECVQDLHQYKNGVLDNEHIIRAKSRSQWKNKRDTWLMWIGGILAATAIALFTKFW